MKRPSWIPPIAAIASLLVAGSCCLPLGVFMAAAGFAGASTLLVSMRPYLLGMSVLMLAVGFWRVYGRSSCPVKGRRGSVILLWTITGVITLLFLFPQLVTGLLADLLAGGSGR